MHKLAPFDTARIVELTLNQECLYMQLILAVATAWHCQETDANNTPLIGRHSVELLCIRQSSPALRLATAARSAAGRGASVLVTSSVPLHRLEPPAAHWWPPALPPSPFPSRMAISRPLFSPGLRRWRSRRSSWAVSDLAVASSAAPFALCLLRRHPRRWSSRCDGRGDLYSNRDRAPLLVVRCFACCSPATHGASLDQAIASRSA